jgi:hypothetical protein
VGTDDLQATGLVLPRARVDPTGVHLMRVGVVVVVVVVRGGSAHGTGSLAAARAPVETGTADDRLGHGLGILDRHVLAGVQSVPHTRGAGRERCGRVLLSGGVAVVAVVAEAGAVVVAGLPARWVLAAVP